MKLRLLPALSLFFASYLPLAVILAIQDIKKEYWELSICQPNEFFLNTCSFPQFEHPKLIWSFFFSTVACSALLFWLLRNVIGKDAGTVKEIKPVPSDVINYVFPYIVSFMGLDLSEKGKIAGFFLFLIFMFVLSYRTGEIILNPILLLFGWRVYEVSVMVGEELVSFKILSGKKVKIDEEIHYAKVQEIAVLNSLSSVKIKR